MVIYIIGNPKLIEEYKELKSNLEGRKHLVLIHTYTCTDKEYESMNQSYRNVLDKISQTKIDSCDVVLVVAKDNEVNPCNDLTNKEILYARKKSKYIL